MFQKMLRPFILTLIVLSVLEIISTSLLPAIGFSELKLPFSLLVVLYLSFKVEVIYLPLFIVVIQFTHGFFSVEGWEVGTVCGVLIYLFISYLKDLINLTNAVMIILLVQLFQFFWFLMSSLLYYLQLSDFSYLVQRFWNFIPESIILSLASPILFWFLDILWNQVTGESLGESL